LILRLSLLQERLRREEQTAKRVRQHKEDEVGPKGGSERERYKVGQRYTQISK
jgi:hypothetical protein